MVTASSSVAAGAPLTGIVSVLLPDRMRAAPRARPVLLASVNVTSTPSPAQPVASGPLKATEETV